MSTTGIQRNHFVRILKQVDTCHTAEAAAGACGLAVARHGASALGPPGEPAGLASVARAESIGCKGGWRILICIERQYFPRIKHQPKPGSMIYEGAQMPGNMSVRLGRTKNRSASGLAVSLGVAQFPETSMVCSSRFASACCLQHDALILACAVFSAHTQVAYKGGFSAKSPQVR